MDINLLSDILVNKFSIPWVVFLFCWCFPLLCKNFLVWCSPICLFFPYVPLALGGISAKILLCEISEILLPMFSSRTFTVSGITIKSLIHYEFILVCCARRWYRFFSSPICPIFPTPFIEFSLVHCMWLLLLSNINWI